MLEFTNPAPFKLTTVLPDIGALLGWIEKIHTAGARTKSTPALKSNPFVETRSWTVALLAALGTQHLSAVSFTRDAGTAARASPNRH